MQKDYSIQMRRLMLSFFPVQALTVGVTAFGLLLNGMIMGHYLGASGLAATGIAGPLLSITGVLSSVINVGSQIKCAKELGRGNKSNMAEVFNTAIIAAAVIGICFSATLLVFNKGVVGLLGASEDIFEISRQYIIGNALSIVFVMLFTTLLSFMQLERAEKYSTVVITILTISQLLFSYLNASVLDGGAIGFGIASALANLIACLICLPYFFSKRTVFHFSARKFSFVTLKDMIYVGLPSAAMPACMAFCDRIVNQYIIIYGGTVAMAAVSVARSIGASIGNTIEGGCSNSANMITSVLVGERDLETLRKFPKSMITAIFPIFATAYALVFMLAGPLALAFGATPEQMSLYVLTIRCANLWFITNLWKTSTLTVYRSLGKIKLVSICFALCIILQPIVCTLFCPVLGYPVVLNIDWITDVLLCLILVGYYVFKRHKLPSSIFRLTNIPNTLTVPSNDRFSATIHNISDAIQASRNMADFCKQKGLAANTAQMCSLCVEEIAVDTVLHGFTRGRRKKAYSIEVRAIYENGEITLMFRDDCPHFDPNEWLALHMDQNDDRSLGLRLAAKSAKEMNYISTLKMNVVTIKIS